MRCLNLGRTALVVDALRTADFELLGKVMQDRLHQAYPTAVHSRCCGCAASSQTVWGMCGSNFQDGTFFDCI